jgi:predicted homoserine dehydrogenase-like protein
MALHDVKSVAVPLTLDKPRTLKYDLNAFAELEEIYGSMEQAFAAMQSGSMKAARTLLWAGLLHEEESLTPRKVGALVTLDNMEPVMDAISSALLDAMPASEDVSEQEAAPADPQ